MSTLQTLASWTIMWCLEQNLVPYKTSRGTKSALEKGSKVKKEEEKTKKKLVLPLHVPTSSKN